MKRTFALSLMTVVLCGSGAVAQEGPPYKIGGGVTPPTVIYRVEPQYSEQARNARYEGTVILEAIVRRDGTVDIQRIIRSLGFGLDENAIEALRQWRFRPGMRNGTPVDVSLNIEVNFNLRHDKPLTDSLPEKLPPDTNKIHWIAPRATILSEQWIQTGGASVVTLPWGTASVVVPIGAEGIWAYRLNWGNYLLDVQAANGRKLDVTINGTVPLGNEAKKWSVIRDDAGKDVRVLYLRKELKVSKPESVQPPANQGGAYVYWNPIYPMPAYDTYEWTITVAQLPNRQSYYYWALQNGFVGGDTFYMGLQPYGTPGVPCPGGGPGCKIALFSFFGKGATSTSPNCIPSADGGPGQTCRVIYDWTVGRPYTFVARRTSITPTLETWIGTVTDMKTGVQTIIGLWSIPASDGLIGTQGSSFAEYFRAYPGGCRAEPDATVVWNAPIGYNNGQAYPGEVRDTAPTPACSQNSAFARTSGSITVHTGGSIP